MLKLAVRSKLTSRNRAGFKFDTTFQVIEVTPEQKALLVADEFLIVKKVNKAGEPVGETLTVEPIEAEETEAPSEDVEVQAEPEVEAPTEVKETKAEKKAREAAEKASKDAK